MRIRNIAMSVILPALLASCVSSKKFKSLQSKYDDLNKSNMALQNDLKSCRDQKSISDAALSKKNCQ